MDLKVLALFAPRNFVTLNSMWMLVNACSVEGTMKKINVHDISPNKPLFPVVITPNRYLNAQNGRVCSGKQIQTQS